MTLNSFLASSDFCPLLITFDLEPSHLTLIVFLEVDIEKSEQRTTNAWKINQALGL